MTKTRDLANLVSGSNPLVDGVIDYSEITNTPAPFDPDTLAAVAVSGAYADLGGKPALATVATSGSFTDLSNQPAPFDPATLAAVATTGAYSSLSGTPALAAVATTGAYGNLTGTPALAAVATSGAYSSLSGTPAAALPLTGGTLSGTLSTPALNIGATQVISNARALTNIASVDATTAAAITTAGVGGPAAWVTGGTYTAGTYYFNGSDTGFLDVSSIITGMPSSPSKLLIVTTIPSNIYAAQSGYGYWYFANTGSDVRVGPSSGSYTTLASMAVAGSEIFENSSQSAYGLIQKGFNGSPPSAQSSGSTYFYTGGSKLRDSYPNLGPDNGSSMKTYNTWGRERQIGTHTTIGYIAINLLFSNTTLSIGGSWTGQPSFRAYWQT